MPVLSRNMAKEYKIEPLVYLVEDAGSVKFHVKNDDYFGTIATVLSLIRQDITKNNRYDAAVLEKLLVNLEGDLNILQKNYQIKARAKNKNKTPKGKLKSQ